MTGDVKRLDAAELKRQLHDGGEIALLDAREEGVFHARHLLLASCVPSLCERTSFKPARSAEMIVGSVRHSVMSPAAATAPAPIGRM